MNEAENVLDEAFKGFQDCLNMVKNAEAELKKNEPGIDALKRIHAMLGAKL